MLFLDQLDVPAAGCFQQSAGFDGRILRVSRLDHDEKFVVRGGGEAAVFQERMIETRQAVEQAHADQRGERREQNGQFVRNRERVERAEERLAADDDLVIEAVHEPDHRHAGGVAHKKFGGGFFINFKSLELLFIAILFVFLFSNMLK